MNVAIVGAGGVGSYYGGELARAGNPVSMLARGPHLDVLRRSGLTVRTPEGEFRVAVRAVEDARELGAPELVVLAVKAYDLDGAAPLLVSPARSGSAILPLLNGVDIAERLVERGVPREAVLGGVTYISAVRVAPGEVERRSPFRRIRVGELDGEVSERATAVAEAFAAAGVDALAVPIVRVELWRKFVFLVAMSAACGLARASIGAVRGAVHGPQLLERAVAEACAVGRAAGVELPPDEEARALELLDALPPDMRPSFLLDLEAGGPTELPVLSETVASIGRSVGVPTPVHDTATAAFAAAMEAGAGATDA